ncbi:hypothetical protein Salat_0987500 [Sesamum alatum]|uniref:Uncharacterized protein n=1 Tax=Sesamum alatum TaxID=300844 RepID=A0AAE1YKV9_9LAMI|nr:hypothetical protein Salat_0987500 [Sesamum alatum]
MEEKKKQIPHGECPRKLNLNVPLLSTRRPFGVTDDHMLMLPISNTTSKDTCNMVPFSWERIPGEPKDKEQDDDLGNIDDVPQPPRPPPGWWQPQVMEELNSATVDQCSDYYDGICDADEENGHNERFSDAIDIFSLAESVDDDDIEVNCEATKDISSAISEPDGYNNISTNFIIQRFLPDAQALAEASVVNKKLPFPSSPYSYGSFSRGVSIRKSSYQSPKGCGLRSFFPWRMKPKPCSVKSPVCDAIAPIKSRSTDP